MKFPLLFLPLLILVSQAGAQPEKTAASPAADLAALHTLTIRLNEAPAPSAFSGPFCYFEVLDERTDTSRVGVHGNLPMHSHEFDRQLIFPGSTAQEIARYFNRHFTRPDAPDTALVVLRDLWLSDTDPYDIVTYPDHPVDEQHQRMDKTHIRLKAEIYACRDHQYLPLLRIDTLQNTKHVLYNTIKSTYTGWEKELATLFHELAENAAGSVARKEDHSRWISWEDISRFNQARFDIPIFSGPTLVRGVYASFEEFRDNAPSIHDFELKMENGGRALYLKNSDGTSYYTHDAWGYCDGKQIFLMRDGLLQAVRKAGNSFYFYGIEANDIPPPPGIIASYNEHHCLYIIDMDTGKFY